MSKRPRISSPLATQVTYAGSNKSKREDEEQEERTSKRLNNHSLKDTFFDESEDPQAPDLNLGRPNTKSSQEVTSSLEPAEATYEAAEIRAKPTRGIASTPIPTSHFKLVSPTRANVLAPETKSIPGTHVPERRSRLRISTPMCSKEEIASEYEKKKWTEPVLLGVKYTKKSKLVKPRTSKKSNHPHFYSPLGTILPGYKAIQIHSEDLGLGSDIADTAKCFFHEAIVSGQCNELNPQAIAATCIGYAQEAAGAEPDWYKVFLGLKLTQPEKSRAVIHLHQYFFIWSNYK